MENLQLLWNGMETAFRLQNFMAAFLGAFLGLIVGALPGIGSLAGVALLLPLTFKMDPTTAIIGLAALYYSTMYGGSFSAILLNIPGDSPAVMTSLDGYPLARSGKAGAALQTSNFSSFVGGSIGIVILTVSGPLLADWGLAFGPAELALLVLFAMTSIGWLLGENPRAGMVSTGLGIMMATMGVDRTIGLERFSFGSYHLLGGMAFIPLVIGLFGFSQVIEMVVNRASYLGAEVRKVTLGESLLTWKEMKRITPATMRTGIMGTFIGVMPGAGATAASFISYLMEKRVNKNKAMIGKGALEGVAAAESSNNAAAAGAFAPLLSLGIPGSGTTAVLLGGLMMWGLQPGPMLFKNNPEFAWGLIASMYIANIICLVMAFSFIPLMVRVVKAPISALVPVISVVCVVGTYAVNNSLFDVYLMIFMGLLAYLMSLAKIPTAPLLLAFVLTPLLESYVRQAFDISGGSLGIFFDSNISRTLVGLILLFCLAPAIIKLLNRRNTAKRASANV